VRDEGPAKVTGAARYTADVPLRGALWAKCLRSPHPHARILRIDASRAQRLPGVRAVLVGSEFPASLMGRRLKDQPIVARDVVRFIGERVAAVAATDLDTAEEALQLIDVEYEELPAVFDAWAAMESDAPILHPELLSYEGLYGKPTIPNVHSHMFSERGDLDAGFAASDLVFEHTFTTPAQHQGYLEPYSVLVGIDPSGRPDVWMSNKGPFNLRAHLAAALDMPEDWVRCNPANIGGEFGGKGSPMDAPVAYQLARRTGKPVRIVMTYTEELTAGNPRHPAIIRLKTGVKRDGTLVARDSLALWNSGAYGGHKPVPTVHILGGLEAAGSYRIPHLRMDSRCVYTNQIPGGFMRSPGQPQMAFAFESQMDIMAHELGLTPVEMRLRNVIHEGDVSGRGHKYRNVQGEQTIRAAVAAGGLDQPKPAPTQPSGLVGRGLALVDRGIGGGETGVVLRLRPSGDVEVRYGVPDQGVGMSTMLRQVVAEALGLTIEQVSAVPSDTDTVPYDAGAGASRHTYIAGRAGLKAAEELAGHLSAAAAALLNAAPDAVRRENGEFRVDGRAVPYAAAAERAAREAGGHLDVTAEVNMPYPDQTCFSAQVAEVEVDPETGQVKLRNLIAVHDVGTVINPLTHQGQIDGGVVQGIGQALLEHQVYDRGSGQLITGSFMDYAMPRAAVMPNVECLLEEVPCKTNPLGVKGIGESGTIGAPPAVINALIDALRPLGVDQIDMPATPSRVWETIQRARKNGGAATAA
jgi:CO/xanthine dehydrogenase Mo-binding subunit